MEYNNTKTYEMKRSILRYAGKITAGLSYSEKKFAADITYGMLASNSCLLTDVAQRLQEDTKKINTVDRLSRHLAAGIDENAERNYLHLVRKWAGKEPIIHIDDSDVVKPDGHSFEALGIVRDGSKSTKEKTVLNKGYHVTEACILTTSRHPVSIFSRVHSSREENFTSINSFTFSAIERGVSLFPKATYVMDRGYDSNKIFQKLAELGQDYVIRLTQKRKLFHHGRWLPATQLCAQRKGKVKMKVRYKQKDHQAYLSHVKVQITASRQPVYLVLVYGITEAPMMLVTNKVIRSKDDVMKVAALYFSRWKIEEYFRSKKQIFSFENFRVRKLQAINALNFYIGVCMSFLAAITRKSPANGLLCAILAAAKPIKSLVFFHFYRIAAGIREILCFAKAGIRLWFKPIRPNQNQLRFSLAA